MTYLNKLSLPLSIAPMIDWTYSPFRVFMRYLAPNALLYTEMQVTGAVKNNSERALFYNQQEHPIAIQLGGSDPIALAECAKMAEEAGYDEINLNLGCPSDKVQSGHFGACLMKEPGRVAECLHRMKQAVSIPVTAKTRLGVDEYDGYAFFSDFCRQLVDAGCDKLIIHSRKAWLQGLNPKQNRTIPPVNYDYVYQLKKEHPNLPVVINGNVVTYQDITRHLEQVDGVMLGRLACDNPYQIAVIHQALYPQLPLLSRSAVLDKYLAYAIDEYQQGIPLSLLFKPLFNLAFGLPGSSQWKKNLMAILQSKDIWQCHQLQEFLVDIESIYESEMN